MPNPESPKRPRSDEWLMANINTDAAYADSSTLTENMERLVDDARITSEQGILTLGAATLIVAKLRLVRESSTNARLVAQAAQVERKVRAQFPNIPE